MLIKLKWEQLGYTGLIKDVNYFCFLFIKVAAIPVEAQVRFLLASAAIAPCSELLASTC